MKLPTADRPFLTVNQCCAALGLVKIKHGKKTYLRTMIDDAIKSGRLKSYCVAPGLSVGFERLYDAYQEIVAKFSAIERDHMFRDTAAAWFKPR